MDTGLVKARWPILGLTLVLSAGIVFYLSSYWSAVAATAIEAGAIAVCAALGLLWLLRSWQLALIAVLIPALTAILALGVLTPIAIAEPVLCGVLIPHAVATVLLTAAGISTAVQYGFSREVCLGSIPTVAAWNALRQVRLPAIMALMMAALWRVLLALPNDVLRLPAQIVHATDVTILAVVVTALCVALVCFLILPLGLSLVRFSEGAITRANRLREWRDRMFGGLAFAAIPRWALSLTGIAVVFSAITLFGDPQSSSPVVTHWRQQGLIFSGTIVGIGLVGAVALRDWRAFFSCALPPALVATIVAAMSLKGWIFIGITMNVANGATLPGAAGSELLAVTAAVGAGFNYWIATSIAAYRRFDDPLTIAVERALDQVAVPLICVAGLSALALAPLNLWYVPLLFGLAALMLTPALTAAIEIAFPRHRSVEEIYGKTRPG